MTEIALLADRPDVIDTLTRWFRAQWSDYYAGRDSAEIAQDFHREARRTGLPIRLVAFVANELAGTIILRQQVIRDAPEYSPGLGGLLVAERQRKRGIGTELVRAGMETAKTEGYETIYATTNTAESILERLGWTPVKAVSHGDEQLQLYQCDLSHQPLSIA